MPSKTVTKRRLSVFFNNGDAVNFLLEQGDEYDRPSHLLSLQNGNELIELMPESMAYTRLLQWQVEVDDSPKPLVENEPEMELL